MQGKDQAGQSGKEVFTMILSFVALTLIFYASDEF